MQEKLSAVQAGQLAAYVARQVQAHGPGCLSGISTIPQAQSPAPGAIVAGAAAGGIGAGNVVVAHEGKSSAMAVGPNPPALQAAYPVFAAHQQQQQQ